MTTWAHLRWSSVENIADVLKQRAAESGPATQMCDALSWNAPKLPEDVELLVAHCLAYGRRQVSGHGAELPRGMPACVLEQLGALTRNARHKARVGFSGQTESPPTI